LTVNNVAHSATVSGQQASRVAAAAGDRLSHFVTSVQKGANAAGKCSYHLVTLAGLSADERAAASWIIAKAIMRSRCGHVGSNYQLWETAALSGQSLSGKDRDKIQAFTSAVFADPGAKHNDDHVQGHVAEWFWYLLTKERAEPTRTIEFLETPKFSVTEPGGDGFVVWRQAGSGLTFRLWELKKHASSAAVSATVGTAYTQLGKHGRRYLAQLVGVHSSKPGDLGALCALLVDLWVDGDDRAGLGVGVTSATVPGPNRCFGSMGKRFPDFTAPGQLEGLLFTVEDFQDLAAEVRRFVCSAL